MLRPTPQVHLHWIRESPTRSLELPVSSTVTALNSLPPSARRAVEATGLPNVELHVLPSRSDMAADDFVYHLDTAGRLIGTHPENTDDMALHQALILTLRAAFTDTTPLTIVAEPAPAPILRRPAALAHTCKSLGGLANAPAERTGNYFRAYKALSLSMQATLRHALPAANIEALPTMEDRIIAQSLFTWSAANPAVGRHVDELGVDIHNPRMIHRSFHGIGKHLAARLESVSEDFRLHGAGEELLHHFLPSRAPRIAEHCRAHPRTLNLLFASEFRLIQSLVHFCSRIDGWRRIAADNPSKVYRAARDAWTDVEIQIRRLHHRRPLPAFGSLVLLETVRSLEAID